MDADAKTLPKVPTAVGVYVIALVTILYPAYGAGSYIRQGHGTVTSVIVSAVVSLALTALLFAMPWLARPPVALGVAIVGLLGGLGGAEWTGVPVVLGGAAAYYAWNARQRGDSSRLALAALVIGLLAIVVTLGIAVLEPLTD